MTQEEVNATLREMREIMALAQTDVHAYIARLTRFLELWHQFDEFIQQGAFKPDGTFITHGYFYKI